MILIIDNENQHKDLCLIFDDNDLKTLNFFLISKNLNDDNNNRPLNDEEYDHEDHIINFEYFSLIKRIRNNVLKKLKKRLSAKGYDFNIGNNNKYHINAITKPNAF